MKSTLEERLAGYKASLLEKIKRTNWDNDECEYQGKPRGRKAKPITRLESRPRTAGEKRAWEQQSLTKKQKYNWF